jgi:hypothetical protein
LDYNFEQYKIAIEIYNLEVSRFYTRLNISYSLQLVLLAGIVGGFKELILYPDVFRYGIFFVLIISLSSVFFSKRGFDIQQILIKTIADFETNHDELKLLDTIHKISKREKGFILKKINIQSLFFCWLSIIIFFFWLIFWIYIDCVHNII